MQSDQDMQIVIFLIFCIETHRIRYRDLIVHRTGFQLALNKSQRIENEFST